MNFKTKSRAMTILVTLALLFSLFSTSVGAASNAALANSVTFTILHTNDFHGQLEEVLATPGTSSNPGMARVATIINNVRTEVGANKVLLVDGGDEMQGSLLSNLQQGVPTIDVFKTMGYNAATFGNHEFDWGQTILAARTAQAASVLPGRSSYPYLTANIVQKDATDCANAGWTLPTFASGAYQIFTVGAAPDIVKVAMIGVTSPETPTITLASATTGLCFKDAAESIQHYYPAMKADGADVIVVLSHLGFEDGGYGYGIPIYGDKTLAAKLNTAGTPVNLIIGGHSHTNLSAATTVGTTVVAQAHYNGRKVGRANITVNPNGAVSVTWQRLWVCAANNNGTTDCPTTTPEDATIKGLITTAASDPAYDSLIKTEIGWTNVPITRNYDGDSLMGYFVNDAIYNDLNSDDTEANDVDMVFNNAGGLRADITCASYPCKINYGMTFNVLPFGNQTIVGDMRGDKILELLHQSATLFKGAIQPSGIRYSFYRYTDSVPTAGTVWAWGAFDVTVYNKAENKWEPLDLARTYRVGTNEFLAPAGQDGYVPFKYMTNISYWGDMLDGVNRWASATYTSTTPYDAALDGRITRNGNDAGGSIMPLTILHHNDSHGNLVKGQYVGYTQLATLIKQERLHNPKRTLLLSGGDNIQGDAMMYYFKSAGLGYAADGTPLPASLQMNPLIAAFNAMNYDAVDLGNHEFNFGSEIFKTLSQATFPILGANVADTGAYGLAEVGVQPHVEKSVGDEEIKVAILGITNHRVPNYELPSNIPGLTFSDPLAKAQELSTELRSTNDVVIALTHIGFTEDPKSVEVDKNVDTNLATTVSGLDVIIGSHSHTNPASGFGAYKYLPSILAGPDGSPVLINQAYRYNNTLGEVVVGLRPSGSGYEVVSQTGRYLSVPMTTAEDAAIKAIADPYVAQIDIYNNKVVGQTTEPIDTLKAYTEETNGANLQAEASVWELAQHGITDVDFHLSGAMTNKLMASGATEANPFTLKISDMFAGMPYENSLVVLKMNGPQLKAVLERAYRNYYYYSHVPGYGGYSYYTTCMIDINKVGRIFYRDAYPTAPDGNNVVALMINGKPIDLTDTTKTYNVSTVNYLAAGSCNFNDAGKSLWPLDQIVHDTQYYVRDAVIDYITSMGIVSPKVEGRLLFGDTVAPVVTVNAPTVQNYLHPDSLTLDFNAVDGVGGTTPSTAPVSGLKNITAQLDGMTVTSSQKVDLHTLALGEHMLTVTGTDYYGNTTTQDVKFNVIATVQSMKTSVNRLYTEGAINDASIRNGLLGKLDEAQTYLNKGNTKAAINTLNAFINAVKAQSGKHITKAAADLLIADAKYVVAHPK